MLHRGSDATKGYHDRYPHSRWRNWLCHLGNNEERGSKIFRSFSGCCGNLPSYRQCTALGYEQPRQRHSERYRNSHPELDRPMRTPAGDPTVSQIRRAIVRQRPVCMCWVHVFVLPAISLAEDDSRLGEQEVGSQVRDVGAAKGNRWKQERTRRKLWPEISLRFVGLELPMTDQAVIALWCHSICNLKRGMSRPERYPGMELFDRLDREPWKCPLLFLIY